MTYKPVN